MQPKSFKFILDLESIINEIESFKDSINNDFLEYQKDQLVKRTVERDLEIIGEATKKLKKLEPNIKISNAKKIIGLRNLISHAYDTVEDEIIWGGNPKGHSKTQS